MAMKHKNLIDIFRASRDENDGYCDIIWLPAFPDGGAFNGVLPGPCTDILGAFLDIEAGFKLSFLTSSPSDNEQELVGFGELPLSVQKLIYNYLWKK